MYYHIYEALHAAMAPARAVAEGYRSLFTNPLNPMSYTPAGRNVSAAMEVFERTTRRYGKPAFGIHETIVDGEAVSVTEEVVWRAPFCNLIHFRRSVDPTRTAKHPALVLVAPMSGHYATLLRGTVETFLPDHEVYITDWVDARDVPVGGGSFDLDDYVDYMKDIFRFLEGDCHVFAVCQPSVPVMAAIARMEAEGDRHVPYTVTLAGGPIDTRVSPTVVNRLAEEKGREWFRRNVIHTVPFPNIGAGRRVYPGFLQLTGFMTMNLDRHMKAHKDLYFHLVDGDGDSVDKHIDFYDEYLAVMDLTAEFYLQTIDRVFVNHDLPRGTFMHRDKPVDLGSIKSIALMTVEGENDDITGTGQCRAALDFCPNIPADKKQHFECPKVGHYGVFNGSRFRNEIAPRMRHLMRRFDPRTADVTAAEYRPSITLVTDKGSSGGTENADAAAFTLANGKGGKSNTKAVVARSTRPADPAPQTPRGVFDPFMPFGPMMSPLGGMKLWSDTARLFLAASPKTHCPSPAMLPPKV